MDIMQTVNIIRGHEDTFRRITDIVVTEFPLKIVINGQKFITLLCSPMNLDELVVGYLYNERIIKNRDDICDIRFRGNYVYLTLADSINTFIPDKKPKTLTSSSSRVLNNIKTKHVSFDKNIKVPYKNFYIIADILSKNSKLFKDTGGVHGALLSNYNADFTLFREDIGRHNAVDKIAGFLLLNNTLLGSKILATSGRISSEILLKAARCNIPILMSRSAPTALSIDLANKLGITLVGFVRKKKMNIYTFEDRIELPAKWEHTK